ncbi:MAG: RNase adapter RapZ [Armatimonadota bacterium]|nr:RNase adapter RapZ [Armatimonadota bacterium]
MSKERKQLVIITGMSGSGKSMAINTFEDLEFFCIDNLPPRLIPQAIELWSPPNQVQNVAIVADVRAGQFFDDLLEVCRSLREKELEHFQRPVVLFLDASDAELIKRFKETRRKHPLVTSERGINEAIQLERSMLDDLKENADKIIDTTNLEPENLRHLIRSFFGPEKTQERLMIAVVSFGFKHGVPLDADLVFDVRFLANPFWVPHLRNLNGTHPEVVRYVLSDPLTEPLLEKLFDLTEFTIPQYIREGKAYLTIAIGCTGGKHRSVVIANELARFLASRNYVVRVEHRDLHQARGQTDARPTTI